MSRVIILDAGPLGLITNPKATPTAIACREWMIQRLAAGDGIMVPEIADYEIRRELIRARKTSGLARLNSFNAQVPGRYLPITTAAMSLAAELWAQARTRGAPTADPKELDADVILAAQALSLNHPAVVIATVNVGHLAQFMAADLWQNI
jgi:predicted nucleic acid-binding protein